MDGVIDLSLEFPHYFMFNKWYLKFVIFIILGRCTAGDGDSGSFRSVLTDTGFNLTFCR
jgi:hypothetical protein